MRLSLISVLLALPLAAQWSEVPNTAITASICPADGYGGSTASASQGGGAYPFSFNCNNVIRSWSGAAARTKAGSEQLIILGGGHADYGGNEVYALNIGLATPTMTRLTNPSVIAATDFDNTLRVTADGKPSSRHTYDFLVYIPPDSPKVAARDKVFLFSGSKYGATGAAGKDGWLFDPNTGAWTEITPNGAGFDPSGAALQVFGNAAYDPSNGLIYIISYPYLLSLDLDTSTYTVLSSSLNPSSNEATSVLDSKRRKLFWFGTDSGSGVGYHYSVELTAPYTFTNITASVNASCAGLVNTKAPGLHYNAEKDRIIGWPSNGGSTVYEMNPVTLTCTSAALPGIAPASGSNVTGLYKRFSYFPTLNKYAVVNDFNQNAYTFPAEIKGLGASTPTCVDKDGDLYGTGPGCTGPDADDDDAAVHTGAQAIAKWTTLKSFLAYRGYAPAKFWYLSPTGSDAATCNDTDGITNIGTPCATWAHLLVAGFAAGDMVILRGGAYSFQLAPPSGTAGHPTIILAYPGELPVLSASEAVDMLDKGWLVVDGVKFSGTGATCPQQIGTYDGTSFTNNVMRRIESTGCVNGLRGGNGIINFLLEESVFHDNTNHGVYLGARHNPGVDNTVRRVISYNNGLTGMQWNGRVTGLLWEQNLTYNNDVTGYSWEMGVSNSTFRNNIALNNKGGLVLYNYPAQYVGDNTCGLSGTDTCTCSPQNLGTICPYSETGNVIESSTFYVAQLDRGGASNVTSAAINVGKSSDCSGESLCNATSLGGNTYRNLLVMTYGSAVYMPMRFDQYGTGSLSTSNFQNIIYKQNSGSAVGWGWRYVANGNSWQEYDCSTLSSIMTTGSVSGCSNVDPLFVAHDPTWYNALANYNLRPAAGSPAIGASSAGVKLDWSGSTRSITAPSIGAYEGAAPAVSGPRVSGGRISGYIGR
jgi:hypothetical protein